MKEGLTMILDLSNAIKEGEEILEEGKINTLLFLYDNQYIELASRSRMSDEIIAKEGSFERAVSGESDCIMTAYADFYPNGSVFLMLECETSDGSLYYDDGVALRKEEKESLLKNLQKCASRENTTVEEWFAEACEDMPTNDNSKSNKTVEREQ